jgi:hypothetical protein
MIFNINKSNSIAKPWGQELHKFAVAAMLYKGAKLRHTGQVRKNLLAAFHGGIIALLCCGFLLQGCGYKTKPVYLGCQIDPPAVKTAVPKGSSEKI